MIKPLLSLACATALSACVAQSDKDLGGINDAGLSEIKSEARVPVDPADWGTFHAYFTEQTHVLNPVLVGVAKIEAGKQIHPPHRHADEEYLMITKGEGIWYLNEEERPAKAGDILFARAWDYHGVKASADSALEFVVFKYSGRHIDAPIDPNPELPEEVQE